MTQTRCRWDREVGAYLTPDGDPCKRDDYGDLTYHCTARRTCANHVGKGELTLIGVISPSPVRRAMMSFAACRPTAIPSSLACPGGICSSASA